MMGKYKWTEESIAAVDWTKKSWLECTKASLEKYQERYKSGVYAYIPYGGEYCPCCIKLEHPVLLSDCKPCPLYIRGRYCCNELYDRWEKNRTKKNLSALIDFIASKVKELEAKENG